jgi:HSP20 family protein
MPISRYRDPAALFGLQRLNRILDEALGASVFPEQGSVITSTLFAPTDVSEDANALQITMELPGVRSEDVRLSLENNILTIRGEKRQELDENNERVHRFERVYGVFERTFALPSTVDPDRIEARFENGVLVVRIPKAERARPREIQVSTPASGAAQVRSGAQTQPPAGQTSQTGQSSQAGQTSQGGQQTSQRGGGRNGGEKEGSAPKKR